MLARTRAAFSQRGVRNGTAWVLEKLASKVGTGRGTTAEVPGLLPPATPGVAEGARPRLCFLTHRLRLGFGVDVVVAEQVEYFLARGYALSVVILETDGRYEERFGPWLRSGQLSVRVVDGVEEAVQVARAQDPAIAVAHTPPFFSVLASLPPGVLRVFHDYGEPPPSLFPDHQAREAVNLERSRQAGLADQVVTISRYLRDTSISPAAKVVRPGNDHLLKRRSNLEVLAGTFRARAGLTDRRIVLNVTRFLEAERLYKGVDQFARVRHELRRAHPDDGTAFVLLGKGEEADRRWAEDQGLLAFTNVDDEFLVSAYLDADAYLSTSQWEGYNLGVAQALSFGLPTFASDRGAHREFGIPVSNETEELASWIASVPSGRSWTERFIERTIHPVRDAGRDLEVTLLAESLSPTSPLPLGRRRQLTTFQHEVARSRQPQGSPEISFLILNRDRPDLLLSCVAAIERECLVPYEIRIGDTGSTDSRVIDFYGRTRHQVDSLGHYHFSRGNNLLAGQARGRVLCLLNNDVELITCDFARALQLALDPSIGTVGAYLCYPDYRIQHAGMRICQMPPYRGLPEHFDKFVPLDGYPGLASDRDVVCVTGAMLLVLKRRYDELGGLDEMYAHEAQDADLGLKLLSRSLRNVVSPSLVAFHLESATRTQPEWPADRQRFAELHGANIERVVYEQQRRLGLS